MKYVDWSITSFLQASNCCLMTFVAVGQTSHSKSEKQILDITPTPNEELAELTARALPPLKRRVKKVSVVSVL